MSRRQPTTPEMRTPGPAVRPHQLEFSTVANRDWIEKVYILRDVPGPVVLNTANIVYPCESTEMFRDVYPYTVPIQRQVSIYNHCRHHFPSIPFSFAAALWCHLWQLTMNLHPNR